MSSNTVEAKPWVPKPRVPEPTVSVTPTSEEQATEPHAVDSKTRVAQVPATEYKALREPREKNVAGMLVLFLNSCFRG